MRYKPTTVFVIREIATGKLVKFGSKCGWMSTTAAKGAFALHMKGEYRSWLDDSKGLFGSQSDFVLEEIK